MGTKTDHPILFKGDMVRAILDGRKTQTRRVINSCGNSIHIDRLLGEWGLSEAPQQWDGEDIHDIWRWCGTKPAKKGDWIWQLQTDVDDTMTYPVRCPYGIPGDLLWVREHIYNGLQAYNFYYKADNKGVGNRRYKALCDYGWALKKTIPSIHMPKFACRLWLKVKSVRVERVQDITSDGAFAEGVNAQQASHAQPFFKTLWDSINKKRGFGWDVNPWVWVVEFERYNK